MTCKIHDDGEQDLALADGLCPLCLSAELTALRSPAPAATSEARAWLDPNTGMVSGYPGGPYTVALVPATTPPAQGDEMRAVCDAIDDLSQTLQYMRIGWDEEKGERSNKVLPALWKHVELLRSAVAAVRGAGGEGDNQ